MATDQRPTAAHLSEPALAELHDVTKEAVQSGIREGIKAAINDDELIEAFWSKGIQVAKRQAKMQAGTMLFDSVGGFFQSIGKFIAIGMIAYYFGGWDLMASIIKGFFAGGPK